MTLLEILLISFGLSMDAFAVAVGVGAWGAASSRREMFRLSFHFGLFQFLMPIAGWCLGIWIQPLIAEFDHWIAFGLLAIIGIRMIDSGLRPEKEEKRQQNPTKGLTLILLSVATSIDALAVGLSLAMLRMTILYPSFIIGVVTGTLTVLGMILGKKANAAYGNRIAIAGGVVLILIGIKIVVEHLYII